MIPPRKYQQTFWLQRFHFVAQLELGLTEIHFRPSGWISLACASSNLAESAVESPNLGVFWVSYEFCCCPVWLSRKTTS